MYPNQQPVSMIAPKTPIQQAVAPAQKKNKTLIFVIIGAVVFLVALTLVLLLVVKQGGGGAGAQATAGYVNDFDCAVDQYDYKEGAFGLFINLAKDGSYKMGLSEEEYSTGTYKEKNQTTATSEDGAKEVNYHLTLRHNKDFLDGQDVTEASGYESEYIVNINANSDIVVVTNVEADSVYYCKVHK